MILELYKVRDAGASAKNPEFCSVFRTDQIGKGDF
jgi:hypothetical protein